MNQERNIMHLSLTKYSRISSPNHYYYYSRTTDLIPAHAALARKGRRKEESERVENKLRCLCSRTDYYVIILLIDDFPCLREPIGPPDGRSLSSRTSFGRRLSWANFLFRTFMWQLRKTIVIETDKTPCHHRYDLLSMLSLSFAEYAYRFLHLRTIAPLSLQTVNRGNL